MDFEKLLALANKIPALLVPVIAFLFYLYKRLDTKATDTIKTQMKLARILTEVVNTMPKQRKLFAHKLFDLFQNEIEKSLEREKITKNPLTEDELNRLKQYYERLKNNGNLTIEETKDFKTLADIMEKDRENKNSNDIGVIILFAIAALLFAAAVTSKKK